MAAVASKYTATRPIETKESGNTCGAKVPMRLYINAAPVPIPIKVHIFGLRFKTDCQHLTKNGHPAQKTIGNVRMSSMLKIQR